MLCSIFVISLFSEFCTISNNSKTSFILWLNFSLQTVEVLRFKPSGKILFHEHAASILCGIFVFSSVAGDQPRPAGVKIGNDLEFSIPTTLLDPGLLNNPSVWIKL